MLLLLLTAPTTLSNGTPAFLFVTSISHGQTVVLVDPAKVQPIVFGFVKMVNFLTSPSRGGGGSGVISKLSAPRCGRGLRSLTCLPADSLPCADTLLQLSAGPSAS